MNKELLSVLAEFLRNTSGLILTDDKEYLVTSRLQPVAAAHQCSSIEQLIGKLKNSPSPALKKDVMEAMTTNETSFFRDGTPFEVFKSQTLPELIELRKNRRAIRILCAAASSGQEPYSLAMLLADNSAKLAGWKLEIMAVDIDTKILRRAEEGTYTQFEVQRGLPIQYLLKYFDSLGAQWKLKPQIRGMVKFAHCNLLSPISDLGQFDVIFCRNVLIYFDLNTKRSVLERLSNQLAPDGALFLGGAETVLDITDRFKPVRDRRGVYARQMPEKPFLKAVNG